MSGTTSIRIYGFPRDRAELKALQDELVQRGYSTVLEVERVDACYAYRGYGVDFCGHEPKCWLQSEGRDPGIGWWGEPKP